MTFEGYTSELFFNAPIERFDKSILTFFRKEENLTEVIFEGHTTYPSLSVLGLEKVRRYIFLFKSHSGVDFKFRQGEVELNAQKVKVSYSPVVKFIFDEEQDVKKAFHYLIREFEKFSSKNKKEDSSAEFVGKEYQVNIHYGKGDVLSYGYVLILFLSSITN